MKPVDIIPLVSTINSINNGWAFAAFVVTIAVLLYLSNRKQL
jgi:hypothetical protein